MNLKPYPQYKDSGVEWIGEIPTGWKFKKIKHLTNVNISNIDKKSKEYEPAVLLCNYTDVYNNKSINNNLDFMKATASFEQINKLALHKGDVLITKDSESADDIAVPALVTEDLDNVVAGYHLAMIKPNDNITGEYLFRLFESKKINDQFVVAANGVTRFGISTYPIKNSYLVVPSPQEQGKICSFLNKKTSEIDLTIEKDTQLIELLKEKRTTLINHVVTKGLDPRVKMKDSGVEWIGKIPGEWDVKKLKHELLILDYKRVPLSAEIRADMKDKIYDYYGASGIIDRVENYIFNGKFILLGEDGANLLSRSSPLAFIAEGKFWVNNHAHILDTKNGNLDYFVNLLESIDYTPQIEGSAQPKLTADNLKNVKVLVPPIFEQNRIAAFIDDETTHLDTTIQKIQHNINLLKEYKKSLINRVVTGKVDVREVAV